MPALVMITKGWKLRSGTVVGVERDPNPRISFIQVSGGSIQSFSDRLLQNIWRQILCRIRTGFLHRLLLFRMRPASGLTEVAHASAVAKVDRNGDEYYEIAAIAVLMNRGSDAPFVSFSGSRG
ncbi:unnamed protein product [Peronospora belbahrii]|uniref:Uncharacterized protein n=1 Tax=Peronospora belbahrii TaxID=622444 RepID=A0ABN8CS22_9STRA|nr:unnamed protein product [Peronospora belbahrii]